ncbi:4Fe-4S dicluster domain-containing protein [Christensenellaceae bacterium OttesenSCG-928-K19]|nr:4Fe-4S dicluster domain-containing protein [Christensenellaceae bacterium OttesenSCG-928-K19]
MEQEQYYHSVRLDKDKCTGCTNCIKRCPTEAIRVRKGKARIMNERCIDCGECIRVCPYHAKKAVTDPLESINEYKYKIALPAPALYGQFKSLKSVDVLIAGLKALGFDDVYEVAKGAEIVADAVARRLNGADMKPLISSACPAVVRLIQVRFPELLDNIVDVDAPMEVAAQVAKKEFAEKHQVDTNDIGTFFITPCPAKMTSIKVPIGKEKSSVDGAISILDIYGLLTNQIKTEPTAPAAETNDDGVAKSNENASAIGVGWAVSGGEVMAVGERNALAVDGIANVIRALEEIENDKLTDIDFFEGLACTGGCIGGPLVFESSYVSENRLNKLCDSIWKNKGVLDKRGEYVSEGIAELNLPIEARDVLKLDDDRKVAMQKVQQIEELLQKLSGLDCGSCGSPNCRAMAEDIVRGYAHEMDCIFILKEKVRFLAEEMVDLASKEEGEK